MPAKSARKPRVDAQVVKPHLPKLARPELIGPVDLAPEVSGSMPVELQDTMGNHVAQKLAQGASQPADDGSVLRKVEGGGGDPDPDILAAAARELAAMGGGEPLPDDVREDMEQGLGSPLGQVGVHRNAQPLADMNASAAAIGSDVFFAPGRYDPRSDRGTSTARRAKLTS